MRALPLLFVLLASIPAVAQESRLTPFQVQKARTLLREQLPCLGCHELDGDGGHTAPSLTTVASRRNAAYIRAIIEDPQRVVPAAAMPRTLIPPRERDLIIRYLSRNAPTGDPPLPRADARPRLEPAALYAQWCAACHGARGGGDGPNAKFLTIKPAVHANGAQMSLRSDDVLFDAIAGGGAIMGKSPRMPAFGATLSPPEVRSLVAYIRTLCACREQTAP